MTEASNQCRDDGRCQYAIDHGAEGLGACPVGECCQALISTVRDAAEIVLRDVMCGFIMCDADIYAALSKHTLVKEETIQYRMRYGYLEQFLRNSAGEQATASTEGVAAVLRRLWADQRIVDAALNRRPMPCE